MADLRRALMMQLRTPKDGDKTLRAILGRDMARKILSDDIYGILATHTAFKLAACKGNIKELSFAYVHSSKTKEPFDRDTWVEALRCAVENKHLEIIRRLLAWHNYDDDKVDTSTTYTLLYLLAKEYDWKMLNKIAGHLSDPDTVARGAITKGLIDGGHWMWIRLGNRWNPVPIIADLVLESNRPDELDSFIETHPEYAWAQDAPEVVNIRAEMTLDDEGLINLGLEEDEEEE